MASKWDEDSDTLIVALHHLTETLNAEAGRQLTEGEDHE